MGGENKGMVAAWRMREPISSHQSPDCWDLQTGRAWNWRLHTIYIHSLRGGRRGRTNRAAVPLMCGRAGGWVVSFQYTAAEAFIYHSVWVARQDHITRSMVCPCLSTYPQCAVQCRAFATIDTSRPLPQKTTILDNAPGPNPKPDAYCHLTVTTLRY